MRRSLFLVVALVPGGCGVPVVGPSDAPERIHVSDRIVAETRRVEGFFGVALSGVGKLVIERTGVESLSVTGSDNALPHVRSEVRGGVLELGVAEGVSLEGDPHLEYRLTVRDFRELHVAGATTVEASRIEADTFVVVISGASHVTVAGRVDVQELTMSGASRYVAEDLFSRVARVTLAGTCTALLNVIERIDGSLSGASSVVYVGNPRVSVQLAGTSSIRQRD